VTFLDVPVLEGRCVRLEPLGPQHAPDLAKAVAVGELWRKWTTRIPAPEQVEDEISERLAKQAAGQMVPWATCRAESGEAVGMTTFCNPDVENRRVEIGYTWIGQEAQRSPVNTEAKLLQLTHAFETLDCIAVEFRTHWHNQQSRRAIERLGAKLDGVLRSHVLWRNGTLRDTVVYSITAAEWPAVKLGLTQRLEP
jgi:RimJ/RimL family protein N-acetyltransferase